MDRLGSASFLGVRRDALFANAIMLEERLWIADPKAINPIFQGATRLYEKPHFIREQVSILLDWGLTAVEGKLPVHLV